jgi:hypothetical protein
MAGLCALGGALWHRAINTQTTKGAYETTTAPPPSKPTLSLVVFERTRVLLGDGWASGGGLT